MKYLDDWMRNELPTILGPIIKDQMAKEKEMWLEEARAEMIRHTRQAAKDLWDQDVGTTERSLENIHEDLIQGYHHRNKIRNLGKEYLRRSETSKLIC